MLLITQGTRVILYCTKHRPNKTKYSRINDRFLRRNENGQLQPTASSEYTQFPSYTLGIAKGKGNVQPVTDHADTDGE